MPSCEAVAAGSRRAAVSARFAGKLAPTVRQPELCIACAIPLMLAMSAWNVASSCLPPARQRSSKPTCRKLMGSTYGLRSRIARRNVRDASSSSFWRVSFKIRSTQFRYSVRMAGKNFSCRSPASLEIDHCVQDDARAVVAA